MKALKSFFLVFALLYGIANSQTHAQFTKTNEDNTGVKKSNKSSSGVLFSFGYGQLTTLDYFDAQKDKWNIFDFGFGGYWLSGGIQLYLNFIISNSHEYISTGWFDDKVSKKYIGLIPRLRLRVFKNVLGNIGYGGLGAFYKNERIGSSSNIYPLWSYGFDLELPRIKNTGVLLGVQFQEALKKSGHEKPNWSIFNLQATILANKRSYSNQATSEEKYFEREGQSKKYRIDEEELFRNTNEKANIKLDFELLITQTNQFYSTDLYSYVNDELLTGSFDFNGYIPIFRKLSTGFSMPLLGKLGLIESNTGLLGTTELKTNVGLGDFSTNLLWDIVGHNAFNVSSQFGIVVPTGESRFNRSYEGFLPLGNGFRMFTTGIIEFCISNRKLTVF